MSYLTADGEPCAGNGRITPPDPDVERDYLPHERDQLQRDWERQIYDESAGKEWRDETGTRNLSFE
jgi:hypothetical protein